MLLIAALHFWIADAFALTGGFRTDISDFGRPHFALVGRSLEMNSQQRLSSSYRAISPFREQTAPAMAELTLSVIAKRHWVAHRGGEPRQLFDLLDELAGDNSTDSGWGYGASG
jgi:hypothetical protein